MRQCLEHDFKLLTSLSDPRDLKDSGYFTARLSPRLCWTRLGLWACGFKNKLRCIAYDYDTLTTSTTESSDQVTTYGLPDEYLHCWRQTLPLRGSVVPAKLSACGIHFTSFPEQHDATFTPATICAPMSFCQAARTCSKRLLSA